MACAEHDERMRPYNTSNDFRVVSDPHASNQSIPSLTRSNFNWYRPGSEGAGTSIMTSASCPPSR